MHQLINYTYCFCRCGSLFFQECTEIQFFHFDFDLNKYYGKNKYHIYNAIVRPYFDYCSEVWDVFGEVQCKRLQKLQNRAARIISNMSNNVDHSIALRALGWEPLHIIRKKAKARMMYKPLNKLGPESLSSLFTYKNEITNYKLRNVQVVFVYQNHGQIA